jgi:nitrile hydratase accessory protein
MNGVDLNLLPARYKDIDGPVFREPWEAQAFAMTLKLHEAGHFTWVEWADYLSHEVSHSSADADGGSDYYRMWVNALERLVADKQLLSDHDLHGRGQYLAANPVPHVHVAKRDPIFVC